MHLKRICVVDGQGGGIGSAIIRKLKEIFEERIEIIALGTNEIATANMLKAKANRGAFGENSIVRTLNEADLIIGPFSIMMPHAMMGEITPNIAESVAASPAKKILLPVFLENVEIVGLGSEPLPHLIEALIQNHLSL